VPGGKSQLKAARPLRFSLRSVSLHFDKIGSSARRLRRSCSTSLDLPLPTLRAAVIFHKRQGDDDDH